MSEEIIDILLVDDNKEEAALTIRTLKKQNPNRNIVYVQDGEEAIKLLLEGQVSHFPKLILLDLKMPRMDGIDILNRLKADERCKTIPVVMLTSSREESDIVKTYRLGVNAYIVKPVDAEKFIKAVSEIGLFWIALNTTMT